MSDDDTPTTLKVKAQEIYERFELDRLRQHIKDNPKQTLFYVTAAGIFIAPALATSPLLAAFGLSAQGPVSGKFSSTTLPLLDEKLTMTLGTAAAAIMSWVGPIEAGTWFAVLESAAMGGYGVATVASTAQIGAVVSTAAMAARTYLNRKWGPKL
jgi:hypothetical protein